MALRPPGFLCFQCIVASLREGVVTSLALRHHGRVTEVVCGVIFEETGKVLACRRAEGRHLAGLWEFPGGKVEAGESPEAALARELSEELGVGVEVGSRLEAASEWGDGMVSIRLTAYFCRIHEGVAQALEHSELRWCKSGELLGLDWAEADLPFLSEVMARQALF